MVALAELLGDITVIVTFNEHLGCKSVSATTKAALDGFNVN